MSPKKLIEVSIKTVCGVNVNGWSARGVRRYPTRYTVSLERARRRRSPRFAAGAAWAGGEEPSARVGGGEGSGGDRASRDGPGEAATVGDVPCDRGCARSACRGRPSRVTLVEQLHARGTSSLLSAATFASVRAGRDGRSHEDGEEGGARDHREVLRAPHPRLPDQQAHLEVMYSVVTLHQSTHTIVSRPRSTITRARAGLGCGTHCALHKRGAA